MKLQIYILITLFGFTISTYSQITVEIAGPQTAIVGETKLYHLLWKDGFVSVTAPEGGSYWWAALGGTVVSGTNNDANIQWTSGGLNVVTFEYNTWNDFYYDEYNVTVNSVLQVPVASAATAITTTSFTANWGTIASATSYRLDVSTSSTFASFVSGYNDRTVATAGESVTGLAAGTTYYYRVRAVNASGASANSNTSTILTLPSAPLASAATAITTTSFTANWGVVASATSYRLDVSTSSTFGSFISDYNDRTVATTGESVTGLALSTTYYYRVRAVNAAGTSSNSSPITLTTSSQFDGLNKNYIVAYSILKPGVLTEDSLDALPREKASQSIQYFDGLGRPMQTVTTQGSPNKKDIVQPVGYDQFGREARKYLPYVSSGNNGWYKESQVDQSTGNPVGEFANFYANPGVGIPQDLHPYSQTVFEPSPLNRVLKQGAPGQAWQPNSDPNSLGDNTVKRRYEFNTADDVRLITYDAATHKISYKDTNNVPRFYGANQLYANKTLDEANHAVIEYVDKEGRTVLKRVETGEVATPYAETYYIYDDFGSLITVLPPEAVKTLTQN